MRFLLLLIACSVTFAAEQAPTTKQIVKKKSAARRLIDGDEYEIVKEVAEAKEPRKSAAQKAIEAEIKAAASL